MENTNFPTPSAAPQHTLLLVDDEENILSALRRLLRKDGFRILCANSGQAGLDILATESQVDIIMSDQRMPYMTGTEFLKQARLHSPDSIRIILSGYTDLESVTDAINEGAVYKFLTKPWDDELLRLSLKEALHQKWILDENRLLQKMQAEIVNDFSDKISLLSSRLNRLEGLLHDLPLPVLEFDAQQVLIDANPAALRLLQLSAESLPTPCPEMLASQLAQACCVLEAHTWRCHRSSLAQDGSLLVLSPNEAA